MEEHLSAAQIFINKLTEIVLANLADENFGVRDLARESGLSLYRLSRRLNSVSRKTIVQFIREIRLQKALEMLQSGTYTVAEVSFKTGFNSPNYFNKCFHEYFGYSPGKALKGEAGNADLSDFNSGVADIKQGENRWKNKKMILTGILLIVLLTAFVGFFIYNKSHNSDWTDGLVSKEGKISLAVMPFRNLTNDSTWNTWQEGIQTSFMSFLSNSDELTVRTSVNDLLHSSGIVNYASLTPILETFVARKLGAALFISGSIIQSDNGLLINVQLYDANKGEAIRSFEIEGPAKGEKTFKLIDSLRHQVDDFLSVTRIKKRVSLSALYFLYPISSPDAYEYMVAAKKAESRSDFITAINMYKLALREDSSIYDSYSLIAMDYGNLGNWVSCKKWLLKYYSKYDLLNLYNKVYADYLYSITFRTPNEAIRYIEQMIAINDQAPYNYVNLGDEYNKLQQYDKAIPQYKRALDIYKRWGVRPDQVIIYTELGRAYHLTENYRKEKQLYRKAAKDFPSHPLLLSRQAVLSLSEGDTAAANRYISNCISGLKKLSWSEARILNNTAIIYSAADYPERAEEYYRQAHKAEPENMEWINNLGFFLIDNNRNIDEGLGLIENALISKPDNYRLLDSKGWGLYKKGKYQEATAIIQRSWDLRLQNARYNYASYLRSEKVKTAAAGQN
jgi:AraC-like DNA-binding protein/tetratricopeptide (TPR) repeat protein